jgi:hypothetical protein
MNIFRKKSKENDRVEANVTILGGSESHYSIVTNVSKDDFDKLADEDGNMYAFQSIDQKKTGEFSLVEKSIYEGVLKTLTIKK